MEYSSRSLSVKLRPAILRASSASLRGDSVMADMRCRNVLGPALAVVRPILGKEVISHSPLGLALEIPIGLSLPLQVQSVRLAFESSPKSEILL